MSMGLNYKSSIFNIERSPNTYFRMEKTCFFTLMIPIVNGSNVIAFIFNVIF